MLYIEYVSFLSSTNQEYSYFSWKMLFYLIKKSGFANSFTYLEVIDVLV